jgi:hypothetical protein
VSRVPTPQCTTTELAGFAGAKAERIDFGLIGAELIRLAAGLC